MHLTVGIFGDQALAARLGKKGTSNDIAIYNHASSEGVLTYVCPNSEKIQPLLQTLNMIDVPVLAANNITKEIGEMIIGIDEMRFEKGFIIANDNETVAALVKNTSLEKFKFTAEKNLREELLKLSVERSDSLLIPVDNSFKVKGVGTIVLGIVKGGKIKKYDNATLEPIGKEVTIKGVQSQDNDIEEAGAGMRVGLNLKGIEAEDIKRGYIVCRGSDKSSEFKINFERSRFNRQAINPSASLLACVGLQVAACKMEPGENGFVVRCAQPVAYFNNQRCLIASTSDTLPRIIGSGKII